VSEVKSSSWYMYVLHCPHSPMLASVCSCVCVYLCECECVCV
jgi:hypothetical protein